MRELGVELCLLHLLQAAVGVVDENNFLGVQQSLGENEGAHHVVGYHTACVSDDVRITVRQTEHLEDVHTAVHARNHGELTAWREGEAVVCELRDEDLVVAE